jgi:hypothetical protein
LERVHEQDGKMESEEDEAILSAEVRGLVRQLVRGIKQAKNADREEIREKAKRRKEEIELQATVGFVCSIFWNIWSVCAKYKI